MTRKVFLSVSAQEENLGDLVLRRVVIRWLRQLDVDLHVYVGQMPAKYIQLLELNEARVYSSSKAWVRQLVKGSAKRNVDLLFSPGQQGLVLRRLEVEHAHVNLALAGLVRASGGAVIKLGRSLEGDSKVMLRLERLLCKLCNLYVLRDPLSASKIGTNVVTAPDLAVASEPRPKPTLDGRTYFAISWRYDRDIDYDFLRAACSASKQNGLTPIIVTQVWTDSKKQQLLARELGIDHLDWTDRDHGRQLEAVTNLYSNCAVVLSNRLHALIFAWNAGAIPAGYSETDDQKIWNHLGELGLGEFVFKAGHQERLARMLSADLEELQFRSDEVFELARHRVDEVRKWLILSVA